jgi:MinD-like ATPase involved in chromosome partitioning or flagellar assembly
VDDEWWPQDEEDGAPLAPHAPRPAPAPAPPVPAPPAPAAPAPPVYRPQPHRRAAPPGQPLFDPLSAHNETTVQPDYGGAGPDPHIGITATGQAAGSVDNRSTRRVPGEPRRPEDYPDGQLPGRPAIGPAGSTMPDPHAPSRIAADRREESAREIARREDGNWERPAQHIYAPTPVEGRTAVAGVPVALPPRTALPGRAASGPVPPQRSAGPDEQPMDQVQPGQQVSAEWRHEREVPLDLPQAPESAWAQPPTAPLPIVTPRSAPPAAPMIPWPRTAIEPLRGVPHQVPPAPMPRANPPGAPTTDESLRRAERRAGMGVQAAVRRSTFGLISPAPGRREQEFNADVEAIRRNFGGLRQVTVVNPRGGAGKTVAVLMLAMTFGQWRGGHVLAWDNNETQGTLGLRAQQGFHTRTVRDLLRDLHLFQGPRGRVGDLSQYVRAQGEGMFEVLASDESADRAHGAAREHSADRAVGASREGSGEVGEILTDVAFGAIRDVVSRFYKVIVVGTGNDVRASNWQAAVDATDQLVVALSARNDSAETAARALDYLEQTGRIRAVRQAVTVLSLPQNQRELDVPGVERHFAARTRAVIRVPYDRVIDTGAPLDYRQLSDATRAAWIKVAATVADGL